MWIWSKELLGVMVLRARRGKGGRESRKLNSFREVHLDVHLLFPPSFSPEMPPDLPLPTVSELARLSGVREDEPTRWACEGQRGSHERAGGSLFSSLPCRPKL